MDLSNKVEKAYGQDRLLSLDFVKGVGIIFVAWGHADMKLDPVFFERNLKLINEIIYSFHIPLFFIVSGALMTRSFGSTGFDRKSYLKKITSTVLFPFLSLCIIFGIVNILIPQSFYATPSIKEMLMATLFMQSHIQFMPSPPLWFLFTLFLSALVTYFSVIKLKMDKYSLLMVSVLLALAHPYWYHVEILGLRRFLQNYEFFVVGYILSSQIMNKNIKVTNFLLILLVVCWLLPAVFKGLYSVFLHFITGVTGSLFIIFLSNRMNHSRDHFLYKYFYKCGEYSMLIFVFHMPVYVLTKKIVYTFGLSSSYSGLFIMVVSGVIIPLIIGKIISYHEILYKLIFWRNPKRSLVVE